jgi:hypothetical protein
VVISLVASHAPMLGRTLLYTALTRARQLVVIVSQRTALCLAVRARRRAPRHTALGGPPSGTLRFAWGQPALRRRPLTTATAGVPPTGLWDICLADNGTCDTARIPRTGAAWDQMTADRL